jgi:hypothetical protein
LVSFWHLAGVAARQTSRWRSGVKLTKTEHRSIGAVDPDLSPTPYAHCDATSPPLFRLETKNARLNELVADRDHEIKVRWSTPRDFAYL